MSGRIMRFTVAVVMALVIVPPSHADPPARVDLDRFNRQLAGCVVDHTDNHGRDRRIVSVVLGMPRDLYVYLPPGYDPRRAYPLVVYLHGATYDEKAFLDTRSLGGLDAMMLRGECPPMVLAVPDGNYGERDARSRTHSFFLDGPGGRFEDHILQEVIPFVDATYAIRPGRESHALLGVSAGGLGAMSLAIRHRERVGAVATVGAPVNLRYGNVDGDYFEDFDPATYRWKVRYDPDEVIGRYLGGLYPIRARRLISPVFGEGEGAAARIIAINPADLLFTTDLRPGELPIYVHCPGRDEWNFDAQGESFAWLAAGRGIDVTLVVAPDGRHNLPYFRAGILCAFRWLGAHQFPPSP
jgi:S-formylglutathione hydrolase FrmB